MIEVKKVGCENMKKRILVISIIVIILSALGIGVAYSLWNIGISQDSVNMATTKCFNVEITSQNNNISLENAYPITNENGKKLTPFSFTIINTCDIFASYTVSLESLKETTLSSKFLNAMINNEEIKKLIDYEVTDTVNDGSIESHILAKGSLGSGDSEDYTLRVWIDYDTTMEDLNNEIKTFKSKIVVKAQPSSWSPVDEGYTTLRDAILANEYQSSPEVAIKKIEAKGTPDYTKPSPLVNWTEKKSVKNMDIVKPSKSSINIDNATSNLGENSPLVWLWNDIKTDFKNGNYSVFSQTDGFYTDLTDIDFSHNNYYTLGEKISINSSGKLLTSFNNGTDKIVYKVLGASKKDTKTIWNDKEYDSITYTLKVEEHTMYAAESDKSEKGLYSGNDDYGKSYFYRGSVSNNNVIFANMRWLIVRINGDNSVRLLYDGKIEADSDDNIGKVPFSYNTNINPGYMYKITNNNEVSQDNHNSRVKDTIDGWFSNNLKKYNNYLSDSGFCNDRQIYKTENSTVYYRPYERLKEKKEPTLKCQNALEDLFTVQNEIGNNALIYPVGLLTADEATMAGIVNGSSSSSLSYLHFGKWCWTLGAMTNDVGYTIGNYTDSFYLTNITNSYYVKPVINLRADVEIAEGIGTKNSPYVIKTN